jgi:hypothetical protein
MKIFIQHPQHLRYMRADSEWTWDVNEAMNFHFAVHAVKYGTDRLKEPFLVLFKFDDSNLDFTLASYANAAPRRLHALA